MFSPTIGMRPYYLILLIVSVLCVCASIAMQPQELPRRGQAARYRGITKLWLFSIIATLAITSGLRYYVGTDYYAYYNGLNSYGKALKRSLLALNEPMLPLIATTLRLFTSDGAWFVMACAVLTMCLLLIPQYKYSSSFLFSTLLFILVGNWHSSFNGVRQFLAAAIVFAGHRYIFERNFKKYALVVFLAFCTHRSAIVMIVPYFILNNRLSVKNILLLVGGTMLLSANYDTVFKFIGFLKETDMAIGDQGYYAKSVNILRVLVACAPAILCFVLYFNTKVTSEDVFYINALIMNGAAMIATSNSAYLARLGIYTNVFTPLAKAKLIRKDNRAVQTFLRIGIVALYYVYWYTEVSKSSSLRYFHWIWERS